MGTASCVSRSAAAVTAAAAGGAAGSQAWQRIAYHNAAPAQVVLLHGRAGHLPDVVLVPAGLASARVPALLSCVGDRAGPACQDA